ncbi:MAG: hypothetical protein HY985_01235 [Magnetospirillum sp.]|nr:hypothetical protein [Magnetospirillum sp.]
MMIGTTPLPGWGALMGLHFLPHPDGQVLAEPWLSRDALGAVWLSRTAWSLAALADAFAATYHRRPQVAIPDYICSQSLWPLRQRADLVFYPIGRGSVADEIQHFDMLLLVHAFGWPADTAAARQRCDAVGALLIEDAAHVLRPIPMIGHAGDVVLYSPHKLLAVPDGAVMVVRPGARPLERALHQAVCGLGWAHPPTRGWRVKRALQRSPLGPLLARLRPGGQPEFLTDPAEMPLSSTPMISPGAAGLIARADLDTIAARRLENARALAAAVTPLSPWQPLRPLEAPVAPYRLPMRCDTTAAAVALYARLRAAGLPVESWPDLPGAATAESLARQLRNTVLLLPCHQSLAPQQLAAAYARALGGRP